MRRLCLVLLGQTVLLIAPVIFAPYGRAASSELAISSSAIPNDAAIPDRYSCAGEDKSPPLSWTGVPAEAKTLALIVRDPDAPRGTFVHWLIYNIPASSTGLMEGVPEESRLSDGAEQGKNDFGRIGYNGPCPPRGKPHHYHFALFALDDRVHPGQDATAAALEGAMQGHMKANAELVGIFGR